MSSLWQVLLITGSAMGMGLATAQLLANFLFILTIY